MNFPSHGMSGPFISRCHVCMEKHEPKCAGHEAIVDDNVRRLRPTYSESDHCAALVRMVVAEQWGVAMSLTDPLLYAVGGELAIEWPGARRLAALPCAVDVVAERLGER